MDPEKQRALCDFYREEFVRHIDHLSAAGMIDDRRRQEFDTSYQRFLKNLERVCDHSNFSTVAEVLLQQFETLTRLSEIEPRRGH